MKIFKFGGASIKDAEGVKNVARILHDIHCNNQNKDKLIVVVSAMGKTTNALEKLVSSYYFKKTEMLEDFNIIKNFHKNLISELFPNTNDTIYNKVDTLLSELFGYIHKETRGEYDMEYDHIVPYGELLSSTLVSSYLSHKNIANIWVDARNLIHTDSLFRDARVDWVQTTWKIKGYFDSPKNEDTLFITQGFIGRDFENNTTTLGREGSDFTAAIIAHCLNAENVTIWKDVPGLLNCDPRYFDETVLLDKISYAEAIELTYYGASIIHPKTIKPLQNKNIPLYVKSFYDYKKTGSIICEDKTHTKDLTPCFILKKQQTLISISSKDFSFIAVDHLHNIFGIFNKYACKIRLMQNSAISFSLCIDHDEIKLYKLIEELTQTYSVKYNTGLELLTIRHYTDEIINRMINSYKILMEQRSRITAQFVYKKPDLK